MLNEALGILATIAIAGILIALLKVIVPEAIEDGRDHLAYGDWPLVPEGMRTAAKRVAGGAVGRQSSVTIDIQVQSQTNHSTSIHTLNSPDTAGQGAV